VLASPFTLASIFALPNATILIKGHHQQNREKAGGQKKIMERENLHRKNEK